MKFCIDDANVDNIRRIYEYYPIDGVSTNPSILAKSGRDPYEVLKEIRSIIGEEGELFVQATAATADGMSDISITGTQSMSGTAPSSISTSTKADRSLCSMFRTPPPIAATP